METHPLLTLKIGYHFLPQITREIGANDTTNPRVSKYEKGADSEEKAETDRISTKFKQKVMINARRKA